VNWLRQSTAGQEVLLGPFLDDTDGKTAETALTIANTDIKVWKTGATSEANKNSGGATHVAAGRYYAVFDATDTDTIGPGEVNVHVAGALPIKVKFCVLDEAVYDVLFGTTALSTYAGGDTAGTTTLLSRIGGALTISGGAVDANVTKLLGTAWLTPAVAGTPDVNTKTITPDAINSNALATSGVNEIRDAITGFSGSLSVNASGMIRIADGTGTGEIDTVSGRVQITETQIDQIVDETWEELIADHSGTSGSVAEQIVAIAQVGGQNFNFLDSWNSLGFSSLIDDYATNKVLHVDIAGRILGDDVGSSLAIVGVGAWVLDDTGNPISGGGGGPSAAMIADAVCDELLSGHTTPGSLAAALTTLLTGQTTISGSLTTAFSGINTKLDTIDDFVDTEISTILSRIGVPAVSLAQDIADINDPTTSQIATAVRDITLVGSAAGSLGNAASTAATQAATAASQAAQANTQATQANSAATSAANAVNNGSTGTVAISNAIGVLGNNQTILLARIGTFTGSGNNTILGFLKALARTDAPLPSDLGGTYDPATDALEADVTVDVDEAAIAAAVVAALGDIADPLLVDTPGDYPVGSAGWRIGKIGTAEVTVISPLSGDSALELVKGDSYTQAFARQLEWQSDDWPVLSGTDLDATVEFDDGRVIVTADIAAVDRVTAELTSADTNSLGEGIYDYSVVVSSGEERMTLVRGKCTVIDREDT
jgi:hypothetical protein